MRGRGRPTAPCRVWRNPSAAAHGRAPNGGRRWRAERPLQPISSRERALQVCGCMCCQLCTKHRTPPRRRCEEGGPAGPRALASTCTRPQGASESRPDNGGRAKQHGRARLGHRDTMLLPWHARQRQLTNERGRGGVVTCGARATFQVAPTETGAAESSGNQGAPRVLAGTREVKLARCGAAPMRERLHSLSPSQPRRRPCARRGCVWGLVRRRGGGRPVHGQPAGAHRGCVARPCCARGALHVLAVAAVLLGGARVGGDALGGRDGHAGAGADVVLDKLLQLGAEGVAGGDRVKEGRESALHAPSGAQRSGRARQAQHTHPAGAAHPTAAATPSAAAAAAPPRCRRTFAMSMLGMTTTCAMSPSHASCHLRTNGSSVGRSNTTVLDSSLSMDLTPACLSMWLSVCALRMQRSTSLAMPS